MLYFWFDILITYDIDMCDNDEEKFEEILPCVLKVINGLKCNKKIQLCKSWVMRLQRSDPDEYELRNQYLCLLWTQLDDKHLNSPFLTCPPCYGKLPPLEKQVPMSIYLSLVKCFSTSLIVIPIMWHYLQVYHIN